MFKNRKILRSKKYSTYFFFFYRKKPLNYKVLINKNTRNKAYHFQDDDMLN